MKQSNSSGRTPLHKSWSFIPRDVTFSQIRICELKRCKRNLNKIAEEVENPYWMTSILTKKKITACTSGCGVTVLQRGHFR